METVTTLPRSRPFTRHDLDSMPDDGHRYELIDGALIVTPAPSYRHQDVVGHLHIALVAACPAELKVLLATFDVALADDTVMQPDLLVARRSDFTARDLPTAPVLAVEVLSPSTRHIDRSLKRARLEVAGCHSYWVVDPMEPSVTAWELSGQGDLVGQEYVEVAHVTGDEELEVTEPFPLTLRPNDLLD